MKHPLDNPVWHALCVPHRDFAIRRGRALHYPREVAAFSAIDVHSAAAYADLAHDLPPDCEARLVRGQLDDLPAGWIEVDHLPLLQMVAREFDGRLLDGPEITTLGRADVDAACALVELTKPGPFGTRTLEMGRYIGVFENGQLLALAGERMRLVGYVELSAICTHPRSRGRRLGEHLMRHLMRDAVARGQTPFLHVVPANAAAIALYRRLGFSVRAEMHYVWRKPVRASSQAQAKP